MIETMSPTFNFNWDEQFLEEPPQTTKSAEIDQHIEQQLYDMIISLIKKGYLHISVLNGSEEAFHHVIQVAPNSTCLDVRNDVFQTALHLAVLTSQPHMARHLILCNANISKCDRYARTPLHWAVALGNLECVRALVAPVTCEELAAIKGVRFELRRSLKNNTINNTDYEGMTCVHLAAAVGSVEIMRQLVLHGGDVNAREWKSGLSPLHIAVEKRNLPMVQFLASLSIRIDNENFAGLTPYQMCCDEQIKAVLEEAGAARRSMDEEMDEEDDYSEEEEDEEEMYEKPSCPIYYQQTMVTI